MALDAEEKRYRHRCAVQRYRENQSEAARAERLKKQREYARAKRHQTAMRNRTNMVSPFTATERPALRPISRSTQQAVLKRLQKALGADGLNESVCAVCDRLVLSRRCQSINPTNQTWVKRLKRLLDSDSENLPPALGEQYECSALSSELSGILLSPRGITTKNGIVGITVCSECDTSLCLDKVPKYLIKNGFFIGELPAIFEDTTLVERYMVQPVSTVAITRVMRGGAHRALRSHCLAFAASPGPPASLLPRRLSEMEGYRVVLAGPFTDMQRAKARKMHRIRRKRVEDLLEFFRRNNSYFAGIPMNFSELESEQVLAEQLFYEPATSSIARDIAKDRERVTEDVDECYCDEDELIERRMVFADDGREVDVSDVHVGSDVVEMDPHNTTEPQFLVRHSSRFAQDDGDLFAKMFPTLFPFGRGHPGEPRSVPVSLLSCVQYYCSLSTRAFAEDELFTLVTFDRVSMKNMYLRLGLRCKRNSRVYDGYSDISRDELAAALRENERRRQGRISASHDHSPAMRFLKSVELSETDVWGSDGERDRCRRRVFAYQARFGQPALFATLTPNVAGSFVLAHYTGIASVDSLFDVPLATLPGRGSLRSAAFKNDVASARLFMRNMDAFIEHVLGVPPDHMQHKPFDGLFGPLKAYFGMVETQGGGTLHAHFLVWLLAAPPNSSTFKHLVQERGEMFLKEIEDFTDSIVTTDFPIPVEASTCRFCGHSYPALRPINIPECSRMKPKDEVDCSEPTLLECGNCLTKVSLHHVVRQVLLQNRPTCWPPPMRTLTRIEFEEKAVSEGKSRGGVDDAKLHIYERERTMATGLCEEDFYGSFLASINNAQGWSDGYADEVFKRDEFARVIEMMPPSLDDLRWGSGVFKFMVAVLVFLLNLHWWNHASSCFKRSRVSAEGYCRYGFPRDRLNHTSFTEKGVQLRRQPASEYVNGFNEVMMATFKSNHDVQVLIGGESVLDRIYYCCKYVTKQQQQVDSVAAIALAAFKRREEKEASSRAAGRDQNNYSLNRQRVASLTYALTSRREIAGPLAALFLLRQSCSYQSTPCMTLPLLEILKELFGTESYDCALINLQSAHDSESVEISNTYRSASALDDYHWRPRALEQVNLYEFAMEFFRRMRSEVSKEDTIFLNDHPLHRTHSLGRHRSPVVPVVTGIRMPCVNDMSPTDLVVKRCKVSMVLFKPFRAPSDLLCDYGNDNAWIDAYSAWEPTRSEFVKEIMNNMEDYFHAQEKVIAVATNAESDSVSNDGLGNIDEFDELVCTAEFSDMAASGFSLDADPDNLWAGGAIPDTNTLNPAVYPSSQQQCEEIDIIIQSNLLLSSAQFTVDKFREVQHSVQVGNALDTNGEIFTLEELRGWINSDATDDNLVQQYQHEVEQPTEVIELFSEALRPENMEWRPNERDPIPERVGSYAPLESISHAKSLNERQHIAFCIAGKALLKRFYEQDLAKTNGHNYGYSSSDYEACIQRDQLLMFLSGAGGTGKNPRN